MVGDSGVHPPLHPNYHHQIVYVKFKLKIHFPPPYEREIGHYGQGKTELIRRTAHELNWQRAFSNLNINEKVSLFNQTILNIALNFIPHETVMMCDDRDPPWINTRIKNLINDKKYLIKNIFVAAKTLKYSKNLSYFKMKLLI